MNYKTVTYGGLRPMESMLIGGFSCRRDFAIRVILVSTGAKLTGGLSIRFLSLFTLVKEL